MKTTTHISERLLPFMVLILMLLSLTGIWGGYAQAPIIHLENNFGGSERELVTSIVQNTGYIIAGRAKSSDGDVTNNVNNEEHSWIIKVDHDFNLVWEKFINPGSNSASAITKIRNSPFAGAGGFIATGYIEDNNFNPPKYKATYLKLNTTGNITWSQSIGGWGTQNDDSWEFGHDIHQLTDGSYILAGTTAMYAAGELGCGGNGAIDYLIIKINLNGTIQWSKCFGGSDNDTARAIFPTTDGGFIVAGDTRSNNGDFTDNPSAPGNNAVGLVKLNSAGTIQWTKIHGGVGNDVVEDIKQTADGGYIFVGGTNSGEVCVNPGGNLSMWAVKTDASGELEWRKCYGGSALDRATTVIIDDDGGYILSGQTSSSDGDVSHNNGGHDLWLLKIDASGNLIWEKTFGGSLGEGRGVVTKNAGGQYIVAGNSSSSDGDVGGNNGDSDFWVVKLSHEPLSIEDIDTINSKVFPNPALNNLNIQTTNPIEKIEIFDALGKLIFSKSYFDKNSLYETVDISHIRAGNYILKVYSDKHVNSFKIIKK